jgi:hypothetical protein
MYANTQILVMRKVPPRKDIGGAKILSLELVWKPYFPTGFFIFPREINLFFLRKLKISKKKCIAKLAFI